MNKTKVFIIIGLLILSGVLIFLQRPRETNSPQERSDVVITVEKTMPPATSSDDALKPETKMQDESADPEVKDYIADFQETLGTIPTVDSLQNLSEKEVHHTPQVLRESVEKLAELIDRAESTPKLRQEALRLLSSCAEQEDSPPSIRALCWKKIVKNIPRWKVFIPLSNLNVPQDIKDLASKLQ